MTRKTAAWLAFGCALLVSGISFVTAIHAAIDHKVGLLGIAAVMMAVFFWAALVAVNRTSPGSGP